MKLKKRGRHAAVDWAVQALPPARRGGHDGGLNVIAKMLADEGARVEPREVTQWYAGVALLLGWVMYPLPL